MSIQFTTLENVPCHVRAAECLRRQLRLIGCYSRLRPYVSQRQPCNFMSGYLLIEEKDGAMSQDRQLSERRKEVLLRKLMLYVEEGQEEQESYLVVAFPLVNAIFPSTVPLGSPIHDLGLTIEAVFMSCSAQARRLSRK